MPLYRVTHREITFIELEASTEDEAKAKADGYGPWFANEDHYEVEQIEEHERIIHEM